MNEAVVYLNGRFLTAAQAERNIHDLGLALGLPTGTYPGLRNGPKSTTEPPMIFRLTQNLAKKLKEGTLPAVPRDENPYADWSAQLFTADRTQYIVVANTRSFYSVVMYGKGITDYSDFIGRALSALREFMEADRLTFVYQRLIAPTSGSVRFAKALDRTATGSMNELVKFAKFWLEEGELSPFDIGFKLNDTLLSAIAPSKSAAYGKPREAFKALADGPAPGCRGPSRKVVGLLPRGSSGFSGNHGHHANLAGNSRRLRAVPTGGFAEATQLADAIPHQE